MVANSVESSVSEHKKALFRKSYSHLGNDCKL